MSWLALSDSFEYLCYGSTAIRNIFSFKVRGSTLDVNPRVVRVQWRIQNVQDEGA